MNVADRAVIRSHLLAVGLNEVGGHLFYCPLSDAIDPNVLIPTEINVGQLTTGGGGRFGEETLRKLVGSLISSASAGQY